MSGQRRSFVLRVSQPYVMVPARVASLIEREADLSAFRVRIRGTDPEASAVLEDFHLIAVEWRSSATGTADDTQPELAPESKWMSTTQAARQLAVTDRAIRKAIKENRLPATQVGDRYRISREDLEQYRAARSA